MRRYPLNRCSRNGHEAGFTLVEMLVSVGLVLLMMSLFASVFVEATKSLATQRGIAENDQRGRMISITLRGDLDGRTFRNLMPYRPVTSASPVIAGDPLRKGYFEIDEGDPNDDTDDVLQFTASINPLNNAGNNKNGSLYPGLANSLTSQPITTINATASQITISNSPTFGSFDFTTVLATTASYIWISGSLAVDGSNHQFSFDGRYQVTGLSPSGGANTTISLFPALPSPASLTISKNGNVLLSELDPEFDDGQVGNGLTAAANAEVCYFLRNGTLYRRVLLIRDIPPGTTTAQPSWSTGPIVSPAPIVSTTFWNDFDYSAFNMPSGYDIWAETGTVPPSSSTPTNFPTGAVFHDVNDSLDNASLSFAQLKDHVRLGLPFQRFGHSTTNGLPQDASTLAKLPGPDLVYGTGDDINTSLGRFNVQECAFNISGGASFGYPQVLPPDPIVSANGNVSPFDRNDIHVNPSTGLVLEYSNQPPYSNSLPYSGAPLTVGTRRGQDVLMTNVLSFDVKVWDPINGAFVDIGSNQFPGGPFSPTPGMINPPAANTANAGYAYQGVLFNNDSAGTPILTPVVGGRLNSLYGNDNGPLDGKPHFRFDTWHPNAAITSNTPATALASFIPQPPYFNPITPPTPTAPFTYNEPPYVPAAQRTDGQNQAFLLSAIQITINYRDVSSNQIRSMTVVQSLIDSIIAQHTFVCPVTTNASGTVTLPTL